MVAYTTGAADQMRYARVGRATASLEVLDRDGHPTALAPKKGWKGKANDAREAMVIVPPLPDGDYRLRATIRSALGDSAVEVPLPFYAPARVHVLTDRPLYRPGDRVQFRAVVLRAADLVPLEHRPGTWTVVDPDGDTVLEENVPTGAWGVTSGSFPLDAGAPEGSWHVACASGGAKDDLTVEVRPFTLPRFRVEAAATKAFYGVAPANNLRRRPGGGSRRGPCQRCS